MEAKFTSIDRLNDFLKTQIIGLDAIWKLKLVIPTLMLLYATLDIMAFIKIGGDDNQAGQRFRDFAKQYIVKHVSGVSDYDLWGARCAILHTATPESTTSKKGKAKKILYSYGKADLEILHKAIAVKSGQDKYTAMAIEDLMRAIGTGLDEFVKDLENDQSLHKACGERVSKFYALIDLPSSTT